MILSLTRPLFVVDCETTGLDTAKDRIVELGFQRFVGEFPGGMDKEWRSLVNPGVPIPADATRTHKITDEDMLKCRSCRRMGSAHPYAEVPEELREAIKSDPTTSVSQMSPEIAALNDGCPAFKPWPTFKQLAENLAKGFTDCDFAGKNVRYDLRILAAEFQRAGVEWNYLSAYVIDADRLEAIAVPRSLSHLHQKYVGAPHDGAHGAMSDVRAAATVIARQLEEHPTALPRDLKRLHELQWPNQWLDGDGKFKVIGGIATCCFGKHKGKALKNIPIDYLDWLLKSDFPPDFKALVSDAKLGKYPDEGKVRNG